MTFTKENKGNPKGFTGKHTQATKDKISASKKGKKIYSPPIHNRGKTWIGRTHSPETKEKMRIAKLGYIPWNKDLSIDDETRLRKKRFNKQKNGHIKRMLVQNGSFHTFGEWELLRKQYNYTCPCCEKSEPEIKLTRDHIIPLSKGGSNLIENIQPLCLKCNLHKMTKCIKY